MIKFGMKLFIHSQTNFNGATVEVWEWIRNFSPHFTWHMIIYPCWESVRVIWIHRNGWGGNNFRFVTDPLMDIFCSICNCMPSECQALIVCSGKAYSIAYYIKILNILPKMDTSSFSQQMILYQSTAMKPVRCRLNNDFYMNKCWLISVLKLHWPRLECRCLEPI